MKNSRIYFLLISISICLKAFCCGIVNYYNDDLRIYRALDPAETKASYHPNSNKAENLQLWHDAIGGGCTISDIQDVVYKFSLDSLRHIDGKSQNAFARLLSRKKNAPLYQFLLLAKEVEALREEMSDPWYYPLADDYHHLRMDTLLQLCKQNMHTALAPRYCVQALRIMLQLNQPDSMVAFWEKHQDRLPKNILRDMSEEYVAGAYYRLGDIEKAFETYIPLSHSEYNNSEGYLEEMAIIYRHDPNHPLLRENAQSIINKLEDRIKYYCNYNIEERQGRSNQMAADSTYIKLRNFALAAAGNPKVKSSGFWHYTASVIYYLNDDDLHARQQVALASSRPMTHYDCESLRAFKLLLDLETGNIDRNRLCADLQWIESKMAAELKGSLDPEISSWNLQYGYSVAPWTDALRKICIIGSKRLASNGNSTLALQLADYGYFMPYRMMDGNIDNAANYDNDAFRLMNSVSAKQAAEFAMRVQKPQDALDRTMIKGGKFDSDYICDLVGTLYLRERNYAEAEKWLNKVSSAYQTTMNVNEYMKLDPFQWLDVDHFIADTSDYKLRFAQEMHRLELAMQQSQDPDRRALAKIRYATGLRNSHGRCWALCYYYFDGYPDRDELDDYSQPRYSASRSAFRDYPAALEAYPICDRLIAEALDEFTSDELKANALLAMKNFKTVAKEMPHTQAAAYVLTHCDKYYDYAVHRK